MVSYPRHRRIPLWLKQAPASLIFWPTLIGGGTLGGLIGAAMAHRGGC